MMIKYGILGIRFSDKPVLSEKDKTWVPQVLSAKDDLAALRKCSAKFSTPPMFANAESPCCCKGVSHGKSSF